ncbi:MAG: FtsX-like permease family protein [Eubacteriales bacterium]|nr:FtsX-like permease family protein [Eubacteriales bacterium]
MKNERSVFYPRLAVSNMRKNANIYFPYLLAGILLTGLYYMILAVGEMVAGSGMTGGEEMMFILEMCAALCVVIMFLILFYINSFVMKRRKKELGLYCILGMEKRHLCRLLFWEVMGAAAISIVGGIVFGALFSQLLFLVLLNLIKIPAKLTFTIPLLSVQKTAVVYICGYLITLVYDWIIILRTKPIELLKSRQEGEREPKTKWLTALTGAIALAGGYWIAFEVQTASEGLFFFFPAALLVMIGTWCLFLAGSIVFLKFLRKRKNFYYRPENFIAVSGMLYRMKQNAAGLSTIAILSTALLVVLSSAVSLYSGEEGMLAGMFPRDYKLWIKPDSQNTAGTLAWQRAADTSCEEEATEALHRLAQETNVAIVHDYGISCIWWMAKKSGNSFLDAEGEDRVRDMELGKMVSLTLLTLEDYNQMTDSAEVLSPNEVIYFSDEQEKTETVRLRGQEFLVKKQGSELEGIPLDSINERMFGNYVVVVPDRLTMMNLRGEDTAWDTFDWYYLFDLQGEKEAVESFLAQAPYCLSVSGAKSLLCKDDQRDSFYLVYGSILFIGILFACLFLLATALIIYYKQVTEGYDDRERFVIMEKVGMRDTEIKRAIGKQVLIVFFLPLVTAVLHICVAARVLRLFLALLGLYDQRLFWTCIFICCLVFGLVYFIIYKLTSRVYYRIVHK